jgi:hypothetical protein
MMPMLVRRKARVMEKLENLYRTATAWKTLLHGGTIKITPARRERRRSSIPRDRAPHRKVAT